MLLRHPTVSIATELADTGMRYTSPEEFLTLLYVSTVSEGVGRDEVEALTARSQAKNQARGISGLLIFDGEHFAQLVEGPPAAIHALEGGLRADPRHTALEVLFLATSQTQRRFEGWDLGYLEVYREASGVAGLRGLRSLDALSAFDAMWPALQFGARPGSPPAAA